MFMKIIYDFTNKIESLSKKEFEKNLKLTILFIVIAAFSISFLFYSKNEDLIMQIKNTKTLSAKTFELIKTNEKMLIAEEKLQKLLEQEKDFDLNIYFEQLCKEQSIPPEPDWEPVIQELSGTNKFDEVTLKATFKDQTTENLVKILEEVGTKEIVYIKDLVIKKQENNKIMFDINLATKRLKK